MKFLGISISKYDATIKKHLTYFTRHSLSTLRKPQPVVVELGTAITFDEQNQMLKAVKNNAHKITELTVSLNYNQDLSTEWNFYLLEIFPENFV